MGKTAEDYEATYTEPELRERLKEELKAADRGGKRGQWSARKSQLLIKAYEDAGGGYTSGGRSESQRDLEAWTAQEWQTADGWGDARESGETARYLPKEAWERMSPAERRATDAKKRTGSRGGKQHVGNTPAAKGAKAAAALAELTMPEAERRLGSLAPAELRTARDQEKRKTLVAAIDTELARRGG